MLMMILPAYKCLLRCCEAAQGGSEVFLTPHSFAFETKRPESVYAKIRAVQERAVAEGIPLQIFQRLPTLIAISSIALLRPAVSGLAVLGEISISGTLIKVDELANSLQVCLDSGAKKVLLPITSAADLGSVPADLIGSFNMIFYNSAEDAVYKALGVE